MRLRPLAWRDAAFCWRLASDPDVRRASFEPKGPSLALHTRWMHGWISNRRGNAYIVETQEGARVGLVRVGDFGKTAELGIALVKKYRGNGNGARLIHAAAVHAKYFLGFDRVTARFRPSNKRSIRAFEKAGFIVRDHALGYREGEFVD